MIERLNPPKLYNITRFYIFRYILIQFQIYLKTIKDQGENIL